jgi:hypothetical protein
MTQTEHVRPMAVTAEHRGDEEMYVSLIEMVHNGSRMVYLGDYSGNEFLELSDMKIKIQTHLVFDLPKAMGQYEAGTFLAKNHREFTEDYINHDLE